MKNTKEIIPVLSAIYCINRTNGNEDKDIAKLIEYLFLRCVNGNVNLLMLACIGKTKDQIMPEINQLLDDETNYKKFLEIKKK
ncbi:MAG: hypothetical protein HFK06_01595 [Clostridia bacterium]|jgi:hypothetical protein|nr:hypothetical protein [Clostridia bacterium]